MKTTERLNRVITAYRENRDKIALLEARRRVAEADDDTKELSRIVAEIADLREEWSALYDERAEAAAALLEEIGVPAVELRMALR